MHLRIGVILPIILSALAMTAVASSGFTAYQAFGRREESKVFLKVNHISQLLARSAGQWAVERGLTSAALKAPEASSAERRTEIVKRRGAADQAFREAIRQLRALPAMTGSKSRIGEAESNCRHSYRIFGPHHGVKEHQDGQVLRRETQRADTCTGCCPQDAHQGSKNASVDGNKCIRLAITAYQAILVQ